MGDRVSLSASALGVDSWKWTKDGADITNAVGISNTATLVISSAALADAGEYVAVFTNAEGDTSTNAATVTVNAAPAPAPTIDTQPTGVTVTVGDAIDLTAVGENAVSWKWQKDGTDVAGATGSNNNASLNIASAVAGDAGDYTVIFTNGTGSITSDAATVVVNTVRRVSRNTRKGAEE